MLQTFPIRKTTSRTVLLAWSFLMTSRFTSKQNTDMSTSWLFVDDNSRDLMPRPNDRNMPMLHIATLLGPTCCVRLVTLLRCVATYWVLLAQVWKWSNLSQQHPTCRNMSQQGGQTHATCCFQQCCDMLRWHVAIVWPGLIQTATAAKKSQNKGFNESFNGSARVINLCTFPSQPTQNKQVHYGGIIFIKPRPNDRNMPAQHIATLLGATCCVRLATVLRCVGCCWLKFDNGQTWANNTQHVATRWPNARKLCPTMLRYVALACCDCLARA